MNRILVNFDTHITTRRACNYSHNTGKLLYITVRRDTIDNVLIHNGDVYFDIKKIVNRLINE